ncbi:MAG: four helix bundle protein [Saprospiraceae bacterium]|nr:four helix bundle protein [Bacteroidia bacterium]NNL92369.1 four helix bundle protein [Saprospiraceae bacterium]
MESKKEFILRIQAKTKKCAVDIIKICDQLIKSESSKVIKYQLIKSSTSVAANYRAACHARSKKEFFSKICIVNEEADETLFWLELIYDLKICTSNIELKRLQKEMEEVCKIVYKAKQSSYSTTK